MLYSILQLSHSLLFIFRIFFLLCSIHVNNNTRQSRTKKTLKRSFLFVVMAFQRSVSKLGFVDLDERHAPVAFGRRPASLYEIQAAANELGIDIFFEPQYMWIAEDYLTAPLPPNWEQCWDNNRFAWYYVNNKTNDATWESPTLEYFKSQYGKQRKQDEAEGRSVIGMASRQKARARKEKQKLMSNIQKGKKIVRRGSISHAENF